MKNEKLKLAPYLAFLSSQNSYVSCFNPYSPIYNIKVGFSSFPLSKVQSNILPSLLLLPLLLLLSALFLFLCRRRPKDDLKQPSGPPAWPVIGNLLLLGTLRHRSLQSLAKRYGPIMSLRLGQVPAVVVSSPEAAEHFLKTHDVVFASRPKTQASEILAYGSKGMPFSEYGPYWRNMRKLCTSQLFSASKVDMFGPLRREELGQLVKSIEESAAAVRRWI